LTSFGAASPAAESRLPDSPGLVAPAVSDTAVSGMGVSDTDRTTISRGPAHAIPLRRIGGGTRPGRAAWLLVPAAVCCAIAAVLLSRGHNQTAVNYGSIGRRAPVAVAERPAGSSSAAAVPVVAVPVATTPAQQTDGGAGQAAPAAPGETPAVAAARKQSVEARQAHRRMARERLVRERAAKAHAARIQAAQDRAARDVTAQNRTAPAAAPALSPPAGASIPAVTAADNVQIARVGYQAPGLGFRIDRPTGWTPEATVTAGMARTWFHSPDGRTTIMVEADPGQDAAFPDQTWRWQDTKFRKEYGNGYRLLGVQRGTLGGHPAVAWSFVLQPGQTAYRKVDILMYRGGHGYAILFSAPADEFASFQALFRQIAGSFRFTQV
ncbi:MAG: hypothetical protein LC772_08235, partial [Chloroflexi bacterium]|nr:hypothetical protein [Chloroflexota bacterium]